VKTDSDAGAGPVVAALQVGHAGSVPTRFAARTLSRTLTSEGTALLIPTPRTEAPAETWTLSLLFNPSACWFPSWGWSRLTVLPTSWRVAGRRFFDPGGRPGPGLPGFGALARAGSAWQMFRNPRRTRAGVSRPWRAGPLPGQPDVGGQPAGEPELGVGGDDQPGPPVGGGRVAQLRPGPAQDLLEESERVFLVRLGRVVRRGRALPLGSAESTAVHLR
jgi:hypothetical protein